ncbi:MAG: MoxR family ATPase [Myxococcota bacterium]
MKDAEATLKALVEQVGRVVVGQHSLVEGLLIGLLSDGHVLVEGVPGLAKTTLVRTLAAALGLEFRRIQFTPDLLPGDLTGNPVFLPDQREFALRRGPIFTSVLLADEINRAPAKVQSALLEAMEERQVTIGNESHGLPDPFLVMATQNPIELEGTYPLPEAQIDRFLLKLVVPYPEEEEEREIVARDASPSAPIEPVVSADDVLALRAIAREVYVADEVRNYAVRLTRASRSPASLLGAQGSAERDTSARQQLASAMARLDGSPVALGASPRGSIYLVRAARARALLDGRRYTTPHDVKSVAPDVLRHRIVVSYEAEAEGITPEMVLEAVLSTVATP